MAQPIESNEFEEFLKWSTNSKNSKLETIDCISTWTDVCGFGNLLKTNEWDLDKLNKSKVLELLNEVYSIAGRVLLPNVKPFPRDTIIVLNDGIAKTVDFKYRDKLDGYSFLHFLRDSILNHYLLLSVTKRFGVGIRTIFAGGERIQYSPTQTTGKSVLFYDENNISEYGKKLLETQFLYNPAEFQMNTAFAKAFTIDSLGSNACVFVNGLYLEDMFLCLINEVPNVNIQIEENVIDIFYKSILVFRLSIRKSLLIEIKGLEVKIYHVDKYFIFKDFDGDDCEFILFNEKSECS